MGNSRLSPLTINRAAGAPVSLRGSSGKSRGVDGREEAGLPVDPDAGTGRDGAEGFNSRVFAVDDTGGSGAAGCKTDDTSFERSPRSISALALTPISIAF
jgi:hypothetical protein